MTAKETLVERFMKLKDRVARYYLMMQYVDDVMKLLRAQNQITETQYDNYRQRKQEYLG